MAKQAFVSPREPQSRGQTRVYPHNLHPPPPLDQAFAHKKGAGRKGQRSPEAHLHQQLRVADGARVLPVHIDAQLPQLRGFGKSCDVYALVPSWL